MPNLLGHALLNWLDRAPHWRLETDSGNLSATEFRDAALARAKELRRTHSVAARVAVPSGRGPAFWVELAGAWLADCVAVPVAASAGEAQLAAVRETLGRPSWGEAAVWFTSGSSGTPKGAMLTAEGIFANAESSAAALALPEGSRLYVPVPFAFVSSLSHFLVSLRSGASFLGSESAQFPGSFLRDVERVGADALGGAPLVLRWALASERPWRWLMASGDRLSEETVLSLRERFPQAALKIVYGMTELSGRAFVRSHPEESGVGKPLGCLSARLDPTSGEVQFAGSALMLGYDGRGRESFTEDGWLRSGDLGEWAGEDLRLLGRSDDVFKVAGNKVSALRIADALWKTGEFSDLAVVAVDHPTLGQVPHAYVVPARSDWDPADTLGKLRATLSADQLPHAFSKVESIPRTGSGKLQRASLARPAEMG